MTDVRQQAGIKSLVWLGGKFLFRDPVPVTVTTTRFEGSTRTANLGLRVDRAYIGPGFPNILESYDVDLPYPDVREPGTIEHLSLLSSVGQPFGLGIWKQAYDFFDGDGATKDFILQRQQLLPITAPSDVTYPDFPTRVVSYDRPYWQPGAVATELTVTQKTNATIGTGAPGAGQAWVESDGHKVGNLRVATLRVGTAPGTGPSTPDCLVAIYLPIIWGVIKGVAPKSYRESLMQPHGFSFTEFG